MEDKINGAIRLVNQAKGVRRNYESIEEMEKRFVAKYGLSTPEFMGRFGDMYSSYFALKIRKNPFRNGETVKEREVMLANKLKIYGLSFAIFEDVLETRKLMKRLKEMQ